MRSGHIRPWLQKTHYFSPSLTQEKTCWAASGELLQARVEKDEALIKIE